MISSQKKLSNVFYTLLGLPATAMGFGLSIQIAVLSWILRTKYGLDIHEIGIVWAAGPIAGILGQPIVGLLSDKVWFWGGRRRPFIIIGGVLTALAIYALPRIDLISQTLGIESIVAVAVVVALTLDLSINISFNPTRSIIADVTPEGDARTKGYTWMQSVSNLFGAIAYLIGAVIGNYTLITVGVVIVLLFSIVPLFFIKEPRILVDENEDEDEEDSDDTATNWPQLLRIYAAHSFTWLGVQTMFVFLFVFLEERLQAVDAMSLGAMTGWSFFILNAAGAFFPIALLQPLTKKIGQVKTHTLAVAVMAIGYFLIAFFVESQIMLYLLFVVLAIGWSAVVSLPFAIMTENVSKKRTGFFMGIFNLSVVIPQLLVSLGIGLLITYILETYHFDAIVFLISGVALSISALLWTTVKETHPISRKKS